jgi:site-specific DNA recombinase
LSVSALSRMLRNPFYSGELLWKGEPHAGAHDPLVDRLLFDRVQRVIATRRREFLMRGVATCAECESKLTGEIHGRFRYYRCLRKSAASDPCRARYCSADRAHLALEALYRRVPLSSSLRRVVAAAIDASNRGASSFDLSRAADGRRACLVGARTLFDAHS